jgi:hypothetical protein
MNLGDIFYWNTEKAIGYDSRLKYHIYICPADAWDDHTFLLINKSPWGDELKITQADYPFLLYDSYVGCNAVVTYTDAELASLNERPVGQLTKKHLQELFNKLADPYTMERMQAKRLCNALKTAF